MSGPVTSVARVEDVQIFLKDPVVEFVALLGCCEVYANVWLPALQESISVATYRITYFSQDGITIACGSERLSRNVGSQPHIKRIPK